MEINREKLHRELWFWLAENPKKTKSAWPGWKGLTLNNHERIAHCFACGEAFYRNGGDYNCHYCPVDWDVKLSEYQIYELSEPCRHNNSIYRLWEHTIHPGDEDKMTIMAEIIAMKEWK